MKLAVRKCLACTGGGLGGLLAGHAGCLAATIFAGAAAASPFSAPLSMFIFGAMASGAGLALWFHLRGPAASLREKQIVAAAALLGLLLSIALHHPAASPAMEVSFDPFAAFCGKLPR